MKSSRFRGAAFAWGAILASGTVYSQAPYSGPNQYNFSQPYSNAAPQQPFYQAAPQQPPYYQAGPQQPYQAAPQQPPYYQAGPQQPYYQAAPQSYYPLPSTNLPTTGQTSAVPVNLAGQINYAAFPRGNGPTPQTSFVSDAPMSVLASPVLSQANTGPVGAPPGGELIGPGLPPPGASLPAPQMQGQPTQQGQFPGQNYYYGYGQSPNSGATNYGAGANGLGYSNGYGAESVGTGYGGYTGSGGYEGLGNGCYEECCPPPRQPHWYIGLYSLGTLGSIGKGGGRNRMARDSTTNVTVSTNSADEQQQMSNTRTTTTNQTSVRGGNSADFFIPGVDSASDFGNNMAITAGYCFNCGCNAFEMTYWRWDPGDHAVKVLGSQLTGPLDAILNFEAITYNGAPGNVWVNNADVHGLFRHTEADNFEANVLWNGGGGCSRLNYSFLFGSRIFVFEDALRFGADTTDTVFDGDVSELFYQIEMKNKLYGLQVGGVGNFNITPRIALNGGAKYGAYVNMIDHRSRIFGAAGTAVINNGPNNGRPWDVQSSKEDVSFLGEVFLGASFCLTRHWSLSGGYRAMSVTGLAEPEGQIYPDLRGINDVESIESTDSLIVHGSYFGGQFIW